jgi:putative oxidoreductase
MPICQNSPINRIKGGAMTTIKLDRFNDQILLVGRVFYSSLFILYGYFKLTGFTGTMTYMAKQGLYPTWIFAALAVVIELGGGLLMLVGYQTKLVALSLAIYVFVAALIAHSHLSDATQLVNFMKNMAIVGGSLAFVVSGAGRTSLDGGKV